jgi:hypothetical protein
MFHINVNMASVIQSSLCSPAKSAEHIIQIIIILGHLHYLKTQKIADMLK